MSYKPLKIFLLLILLFILAASIYLCWAFELSIKYSGDDTLIKNGFYTWLTNYKYINVAIASLVVIEFFLIIFSNYNVSTILLLLFFFNIVNTFVNNDYLNIVFTQYNSDIAGLSEFKNGNNIFLGLTIILSSLYFYISI